MRKTSRQYLGDLRNLHDLVDRAFESRDVPDAPGGTPE